MATRLELQAELEKFASHVYFQPPSDLRMMFPCIVYSKKSNKVTRANNHSYNSRQEYQLTIIERDPDSDLADKVVSHFQYSSIGTYFVVDSLHQTTINLYF